MRDLLQETEAVRDLVDAVVGILPGFNVHTLLPALQPAQQTNWETGAKAKDPQTKRWVELLKEKFTKWSPVESHLVRIRREICTYKALFISENRSDMDFGLFHWSKHYYGLCFFFFFA